MTENNSTTATVPATEVVAAPRATKSPSAYLKEPMTGNQSDFAAYVTHFAKEAGIWPSAKSEQDAFLLGVKGAGLYARYQKAKNTNGGQELKAILNPPAKKTPAKSAGARPGPGRRQ